MHQWDIELKSADNLLYGRISHCYKAKADTENDLVTELGDDGIQHLLMDAIMAIVPEKEIILNTPGPGMQEWLPIPKKKGIIARLIQFFKHPDISYDEDEMSKSYTDELRKDNIPILKQDELSRYYIKLKKAQLPKYLDALGEYGGVPEFYDTIAIPKEKEALIAEDEIKFLADTLIFRTQPNKDELSRLKTIMSRYDMIGLVYEGYFGFLVPDSSKNDIIKALNKVASKYSLTTDLNENLL